MKRSKKYSAAAAKVEKLKLYPVDQAASLVKETSYTKFDGTIELCLKLNLNPKKAEQNLRGAFMLPHGSGKTKKVVALCEGPDATAAKEAGADFVGDTDLIDKIKGGWFDFDIIVATPKIMPKLGLLGKVLGPKGLMPNPKTGTVTQDVKKAVTEIKAGKIEYNVDKLGNIHVPVGRVSYDALKLKENIVAFTKEILRIKPSTVKGTYCKTVSVAATMGPGIKIDPESIKKEK